MSVLRISRELSLPVDVAGEAIAILAKRGAGKTNTATVLVEELAGANVQTVIVDPVGAWWGIRSSAEGEKGAGLSIPILGGQHGDVSLEQTAGSLIADVAVDQGQSLLLDLSDFPSKSSINRFVTDFAERLYRRKSRQSSLLHLVLEEADEFSPQKGTADTARMRGAIEQIVRRGRSRGLGVTLITQRSAVLNKDVLTQADVLIVMRTTGPHDLRAIKEWVTSRGDEHGGEVLDSLPGLETGEAWVWNPERDLIDRVKVRRRRTFDSSATPKPGQQRAVPGDAAPIDLALLGEQIQATAEKAKADDPRQLRKRISELERQASQQPLATVVEKVVETVEVEVPVLQEPQIAHLLAAARDLKDAAAMISESADDIIREVSKVSVRAQRPRAEQVRPEIVRAPAQPRASVTVAPRPAPPAGADGDVKLGKGERTVLDVLAEYPEGRTHTELAFLAGYSAKASTLGVILANLRKAALVEPGQPIRPTDEGLAAAGGARERPTGQALLDQWLQHPRMGEGDRRVLLALIELYPDPPSNEELCDLTGYSPTASTMGVILSKLRKLGLVEKGRRRIAPELMEAIAA